MRFTITIDSTPDGWRATCNQPPHLFSPPDPKNSATAEAALLVLLEYISPEHKGSLAHPEAERS